jgi:DNA-binding CsgD family transcriptional regulator
MVQSVSAAFEKLTPREREILRLIAAHLQSKEIARALGLSPKTVEMHVLSARRRLSGMSRRDAALAFVAWEGGHPGSDYRKRPDSLAAFSEPSLPDREIGNDHEGASNEKVDDLFSDHDRGERSSIARTRRGRLSGPQWLGLVLGVTAAITLALAAIAIGMDVLILAIQRITHY